MLQLIQTLLQQGTGGILVLIVFLILIFFIIILLKKPIISFIKRIRKLPGIEVAPEKEEVMGKKNSDGVITIDKKFYDSILQSIQWSFDTYNDKFLKEQKDNISKYRQLEARTLTSITRALLLKYETSSQQKSNLFELVIERNLNQSLKQSFIRIDAELDLKDITEFAETKIKDIMEESQQAMEHGVITVLGSDEVYTDIKSELSVILKEYIIKQVKEFITLQKSERELEIKNRQEYIEDIGYRIKTLLRIEE